MSTDNRFRRSLRRLIWAWMIAVAGVSLLSCLGRAHWLLSNLSHFRMQYAVLALLVIPAIYLLPRWRRSLVLSALGVCILNTSFLLPYRLGERQGEPSGGDSVSVLLWNTWRKNDDFERVGSVLQESKADVILLQETTPVVRKHLADLGTDYELVISGADAALIRRPSLHRIHVLSDLPFRAFHLEVRGRSGGVDLISTHLAAPISSTAAERRGRQLVALSEWINSRARPVVLVGDLNTTPWSHEVRDLRAECRMRDSLVGCGLQPTWPFHNALTSLLRIPLDHCLHTEGVGVYGRSVGEPEGSNHRPLSFRVSLAN